MSMPIDLLNGLWKKAIAAYFGFVFGNHSSKSRLSSVSESLMKLQCLYIHFIHHNAARISLTTHFGMD